MNHFAVGIGGSEIPAGVAAGQSFVIQPVMVQNRHMQVVEVDFVPHCVVVVFVGQM